MRRTAVVLILLAAFVAGACSGDDDTGGSAANTSIPDDTTTSPSMTEPDTVAPDIIPTDESRIDEAYVEGVLAGLARVSADALKQTRRAGLVDEKVQELVDATSTDPNAIQSINSLSRVARDGFDRYRNDLRPAEYDVLEVLTATPQCIVAEVNVDRSGLFIDPPAAPPPGRTLVELLPATDEQRATGLNPTAWVTDSSPVVRDGEAMPDCEPTP